MERISLSPDQITNTKLKDGTLVSLVKEPESTTIPGSTAEHESAHIIAAGEIISATIIPHGNTLGSTTPKVMTPAAAAAAEALGHDGTGWDMDVVVPALGSTRESAIASAHIALAGKDEEGHEVAVILQERKTIGQSDVDEAFDRVGKRRRGIYNVEVHIIPITGRTRRFSAVSFQNTVEIEDSDLKQAA